MHLIVGGTSQEKQRRVPTDHISEPKGRWQGQLCQGVKHTCSMQLLLDSGGPKPVAGFLALEDTTSDTTHLCVPRLLSIFSFNEIVEANLPNCWARPLTVINSVLININQQPTVIRHLNKSSITGEKNRTKNRTLNDWRWRNAINQEAEGNLKCELVDNVELFKRTAHP